MSGVKGFTLLEVLLALLILSAGLLGYAGTLAPMARLMGEARLRTRGAAALATRLDRLRVEVAAGPCIAPAAGSELHPEGILESWSAAAEGRIIRVVAVASLLQGARPRADSIETLIPCR